LSPGPGVPFLRRASLADDAPKAGYPFGMASVRGLEGVEFASVTMLVGDNGSGKSTIVEAVAVAAGFNAEGGSRNLRFHTYDTHSALHEHLVLQWNRRPRWGWFLRAETFYGMASHIAQDDDPRTGIAGFFTDLHSQSHGESFLDLALTRFDRPGLYLLDEPEAALSVTGQLALLAIMHRACAMGAQFIVSTHSPLLMAFPGAHIYELRTDTAPARRAFDDVESVAVWRLFLDEPSVFFETLFADDEPEAGTDTATSGEPE
jgi:predicted ATPase